MLEDITNLRFIKKGLSILSIFSITCVVTTGHRLAAEELNDWPQWLGEKRDGVWRETGIIEKFPESGPELRWTRKIGGGYSGPAVANGRVFVMDRLAESQDLNAGPDLHEGKPPRNANFLRRKNLGKERVLCFRETDGEPLWEHTYDCPYTTVSIYAIGPRCTPTVDGNRVYTLGAEGNLFCLNVKDGSEIWSCDFKVAYDWKVNFWGASAHPLVDNDKLICVVGGKATVVAFDKRTGKQIWTALQAKDPGYCPPMIYTIHGKRQLVVWHSEAIVGLDPDSGEQLWSVPVQATFAMSIGAPVLHDDVLFSMSYSRQSQLLKVASDNRSAEIQWKGGAKSGIGGVMNTPVIENGFIYGCGPNGRYTCANLETGNHVWESYEPSTGNRPASWANVFTIRHRDRYFLANDLGDLIIAELSPKGYSEISRARLIEPTHDVGNRRLVWSHPAFANQSVYLRNDQEIKVYSLKK